MNKDNPYQKKDKPYQKIRSFDSRVIDRLREKGMYAQRITGNFGPYDILAHDEKNVLLIKAKDYTKKSTFDKDFEKMRMFKAPPCVKKQLWVKEKGEIKIINIVDHKEGTSDFLQKGKETKAILSDLQEVQETKANKI